MPYFKDLFQDCDHDLYIKLNASMQAMTMIIDSLYFSSITLDIDSILEVMMLLDMFRYDAHFCKIKVFLIYHGKVLLTKLIANVQLGLYEMLLYNILDVELLKLIKICVILDPNQRADTNQMLKMIEQF